MAKTILLLFLVSLIPVSCSAVLMYLKLYTGFNKLNKKLQTAIITVVFTITCCLGTLLSIDMPTGGGINVRDASPIIAGLVFGGPAGIIVGLAGGAFRFVIAFFVPKLMSTQMACSISTALAGVITAIIRKYIFNNHHGKWYYGMFIAVLVEDFHMLMVFLTNMNDISFAYATVQKAAIPMIVTNAVAVGLSSIIACVLAKEKLFTKSSIIKTATKVQLTLVGALFVAYSTVSSFTYFSLQNAVQKNLENTFSETILDVKNSVDSEIDIKLTDEIKSAATYIDQHIALGEDPADIIEDVRTAYKVSDVHLIKDNLIVYSTDKAIENIYEMDSKAQSAEFSCLLGETEAFVQDYMENGSHEEFTKYAGAKLTSPNLNYVQIGLNTTDYHKLLDDEIVDCAKYRHINKSGFIVVANQDGKVLSIGNEAPKIETIDFSKINNNFIPVVLGGENYYTYENTIEGYHIIGFAQQAESDLTLSIEFTAFTLMEVVVFMCLYFVLYIVIKRSIVNRIESVSLGLSKITEGDLNIKINERNSFEMNSLSDNINKTVETLKENVRKEAEKNAEELKFAKSIQYSALPLEFPMNDKFEIFASMQTAKEVGGDFYDFYFVDDDHVAIQIADVSGKGIPAAMFMMEAKTIIKNLVQSKTPIDDAFTEANKQLCTNNDSQMFVTAWLAVIDLKTGHVDYVNAGHNPPLISAENGEFSYLKSRAGFVLGGFDGFKYKIQSFDLAPGSKIYLYTDGVTEAMNINQEQYGENTLLDILNNNKFRGAKSTCELVSKDVAKFTSEAEQSDDITMLCFSLNGPNQDKVIELDATTKNVDQITNFVNEFLDEKDCKLKAKTEIDVAVDEIFSNISNYAYPKGTTGQAKLTIGLESDDKVFLIFEDSGEKYNPLEKPDPNAKASLEERQIGGLGIFIVKKTMDDMQYNFDNGRNILKLIKTIR